MKQTETKKRRDEAEASRIKANKVGMSWASRQMMAGRGTGEFENYGERLYVEGLISKQRQRRAEQRSLEERERREVEGVTFKPKISKASREITRNMRKQQVFVARDPKAAERERQMEAMKREREERELKECTFKPRINRLSETLVAERTEALREYDIRTHEQLYQDAAARKERQAQYAEWRPHDMTFKPKTNATLSTHEARGDKESSGGISRRPAPTRSRSRRGALARASTSTRVGSFSSPRQGGPPASCATQTTCPSGTTSTACATSSTIRRSSWPP